MTIAKSTTVDVGYLKLVGFLLPNGKFGMSQTQLVLLSGVTEDPHYASDSYTRVARSKEAQKLVPQGFKVHVKTQVEGRKERLNIVELESVAPFLTVCLSLGHKSAAQPLSLLSGLAIHQLFCDAFGIEFELKDRQEYLKARMEGIERRNAWTDAIDSWIKSNPESVSDNYLKFIWANVSDALNKALTGQKAKYWCDYLGCKRNELRNHWTDRHLSKIRDLENHAEVLVTRQGVEPMQAMSQAIIFYSYSICDPEEFLKQN